MSGSNNKGATINSRVDQMRKEDAADRALLPDQVRGNEGAYLAVTLMQLSRNFFRVKGGGTWDDTADSASTQGNVQYGAVIRELGIPLSVGHLIANAHELYDEHHLDDPVARADIDFGYANCNGTK